MKEALKRFYEFIRAFNFCFGLMLLIFAVSIGLAIYFSNMWYLLLAGITFVFYLAFYFVFIEMLNYYTALDEIENLSEEVDDLK